MRTHPAHSLLSPPLRGRVGEGGSHKHQPCGLPPSLTLPRKAGLSHVRKHIDEEAVVPGGAFELATQRGLCIGMSTSNIEGESPQNGEVDGSMVFSASRLILVENDVERLVQDVFDAPMFANDEQQFCGRVALGQKEVALDSLVASTFAGDPRDGLETREVVLFGHIPDRSNDRGSGFFAAVTGVLGGGLFGLLALCRSDGGLGIAQQARPVVLHRQDVISAALDDGFRHLAMTMQRIGRDDAALQLKKLDELQSADRFVVSRCQHIGKRHAGHCAPRRHHHWRHVTLAAFVGSSQSLAIESYHAFDFGRRRKRLGKAPKHLFEAVRIEDTKDTAEGVVARYPVLQHQNRAQQRFFRPPKQRDVATGRGTAQRGQQRNEQHLGQIVLCLVLPRIDQRRKAFCKAVQNSPLSNQETLPESNFPSRAIACPLEHAIPLPRKGGGNRNAARLFENRIGIRARRMSRSLHSAGASSGVLLRLAKNPNANPPTARIGISFLMPMARITWMPAATSIGSASAVCTADLAVSSTRAFTRFLRTM